MAFLPDTNVWISGSSLFSVSVIEARREAE